MWASYDYTNFPIVHVTFEKKINDEKEFNDFLQEWIKIYERQDNFIFIFDTRKVGYININYCFNSFNIFYLLWFFICKKNYR